MGAALDRSDEIRMHVVKSRQAGYVARIAYAETLLAAGSDDAIMAQAVLSDVLGDMRKWVG